MESNGSPKPELFKVVVYRDGSMEFKAPQTGDAMTDELVLRGFLDKCRETILERIKGGPSIIARP